MRKINILILTCSLNVGGAEKHIHDLVLNSDRQKFNFVIVCLYELGAIGQALRDYGIKVYHNLMRNKLDIFGVWRLSSIIRAEKVDILYIIHTPVTLFWGILCAKLTSVISLTRTTYPVFGVKKRELVDYFVLSFIDKIIVQAKFHKDHLMNSKNIPQEKIELIHNGIALERLDKDVDIAALKQAMGIPLESPVVGIVARLSPEKGHLDFLSAASKIIDLFPQTHFLIVGEGREKKKIEEKYRELEIHANVHMLGTRSDIPQIVSLLNIGVMSSYAETFSNAILEYMAAAKPVVATNVGGTPEMVINGKTGYIVPCNDPGALADAVIRLLKDKYLAKKMGEAGRERVKENFTIQRMINKYEALLANLSR